MVPPSLAQAGVALVVEDSGLIAIGTQAMLAELGAAQVHLAANCAEAVALVAAEPIGLVVLDMDLAGESSAPVARALRERGIPFVVATGFGAADERDPAFDPAPLVAKPFSRAELERAIVRALRGKAC